MESVITKDKLDEPATKRDVVNAVEELAVITDKTIRRVEERLDRRIDGVEQRLDGVDQRLASLERGQEKVLDILQGIDTQLREHKDLPARVARLERTVFRG